eukprot:TRINITY_DN15552_c1_g1_i2.p1 TRINITY_DN15552_c1_g1~~TRINITY_DN15552_c1_g1_i2.p1  ORF type:complete len:1078 (+),score=284.08 TRINITY_DN15552_c1_g1_i2:81-3236(+)
MEAAERRVDPNDGDAYTLPEFVEQYGGTLSEPPEQWLSAAPASVSAEPPDRRPDADGQLYTLQQFVAEYGGSFSSPPQEWIAAGAPAAPQAPPIDAAPAAPAAAAPAAPSRGAVSPAAGDPDAAASPSAPPTMPAVSPRSGRARPTAAEMAQIETAAAAIAARARPLLSPDLDSNIAAAEEEFRAAGGTVGPWLDAGHQFHGYYRWRVGEHVAGPPPRRSDDGSAASVQPLSARNLSPRSGGENPLERRKNDPFGAGGEGVSAAALAEQRAERERAYQALAKATRALEELQRAAGAGPLTVEHARLAEQRARSAAPQRRWRHPVRAYNQRRGQRARQLALERYGERAGGEAGLVLCVVRVQCWWRGTRERLLQARLRRKGTSFNRDNRNSFSVMSQTFRIVSDVRWDLPTSARQIPCGPYGAWKSFSGDHSPTRVSWRRVLWYYAVRGGKMTRLGRRARLEWQGCGGFGLILLFLWLLGFTAVLYLLPGLCALGLKIVFLDGHMSLSIDQIVVFVLFYMAVAAVAIGVLYVALAVEQERFGRKFDLIFSVVAAKHKAFIALEQQQGLRGTDLSSAKRAFYWDLPLVIVYGLHVLMGWATVFAIHEGLGWISFFFSWLMLAILCMYDRLVISQAKILRAVAAHQGAEFRKALLVPDGSDDAPPQQPGQPRKSHRDRDYNIAIMKALSRMSRTFSRLHGMVFATVIMTALMALVLYWYTGCRSLREGAKRLLPHDLMLTMVYGIFTQWAGWMLCRHLAAFFLARPAVHRVFRIGWHFRDMTEESVVVVKHCQMIAKTSGLKASREQPPSRELFCLNALVWFLILIWIVYLAMQGVGFDCATRQVECLHVNTETGEERSMGPMPMAYKFNIFKGCAPINPISSTLAYCASLIAYSQQTYTVGLGNTWYAGPNSTFIAQVWYETWVGTKRGISKKFNVTAENYVCPDMNLAVRPFTNLYEIKDTGHTRLGHGVVGSISYQSVPEVFFTHHRGAHKLFDGCYYDRPVPASVCAQERTNPKDLYTCFCGRGQERPLDVCDCSEFLQATGQERVCAGR